MDVRIASVAALLCIFVSGNFVLYVKSEIACTIYEQKDSPSVIRLLLTPRSTKIPRDETKFYLFTRDNQNCFQELNQNNLKDSFFNPRRPTRIIIHGWMNNAFSSMNQLIKDAYLTKGEFNVIVVDWGSLAQDANYDRSTKWVDDVGELVAEFALLLHNEMGASFNDMYLIGHSLGAQVAGVAGHLSPQKFNTIFALDPAEPNFEDPLTNSRIDSSSANYVESIHTNTGLLGVKYPVGRASFFPNYGKKQIGCGFLKDCSHSRSYEYFAESINSDKGFWGIECSQLEDIINKNCKETGNKAIMGGEPSIPKVGYYYLPTNWEEPFALGPDVTADYYKKRHHHHHHHSSESDHSSDLPRTRSYRS